VIELPIPFAQCYARHAQLSHHLAKMTPLY
jgi:hypothetical protein